MLDTTKNFFIKAWQGKLSLPMAFFVLYCMPPLIVMGTVFSIMYALHPEYYTFNGIDNFMAHMRLTDYSISSVLLPYTIFTVVCVWRCAKNSSLCWLLISRMIVVFALTMSVINSVGLIGYLGGSDSLLCISKNHPQAIDKDGESSLILAKKYLLGRDVPRNYAKAVELLTQAADKGNVEAISDLGSIYYLGRLAPKDLPKAYKLINIAAAKGYPRAIYTLGEMYRTGEGVQKNKSKAISLLLQATSQGDLYALMCLGRMYRNGEITASEHSKAAELFKKVQSPNDVSTMYYLGRFYESSGDFHEAASWITKANETKSTNISYENVCSAFHLGTLYLDGKGVEKNPNKANSLLAATAESVIKHNDELKILDFNVDKIDSSDLINAFVQHVSNENTHQYSKSINDSAAKMADEIAYICLS